MLKSDFRRILTSPKLYISFFISLVILLRPIFELLMIEPNGKYSFIYLQSLPFGLSDYTPFAAIFCVLPFADSFCEDLTSGYIYSVVSRIGVKKYAILRCFSVAISGGLLMGMVVLTVLSVSMIFATEQDTFETVQFMYRTIWAEKDLLLKYNGFAFLGFRVLFGWLFGCLWALVGLSISTIVPNRYVTLVAPFIVYQAAWFLIDNITLNPVYNLRGDYAPSISFVICYQTTLVLFFVIFSFYRIRKKVVL